MKVHKIDRLDVKNFLKEKGIKHEDAKIFPWPRGCGLAIFADGSFYDVESICEKVTEREADQ